MTKHEVDHTKENNCGKCRYWMSVKKSEDNINGGYCRKYKTNPHWTHVCEQWEHAMVGISF